MEKDTKKNDDNENDKVQNLEKQIRKSKADISGQAQQKPNPTGFVRRAKLVVAQLSRSVT